MASQGASAQSGSAPGGIAARYPELRDHYAARGQGHVFRFWDRLDSAGRERLLAQVARIDLDPLLRAYRRSLAAPEAAGGALEPLEVERIPGHGGSAERFREAAARGAEVLAAGRVAALVVAGGQATRLGYEGPKGCFPIGPVGSRSLFELQAQKLRAARRRFGVALPWYVMTSDATDRPTREFFERHERFGLPANDVRFFQQGMVPSFDFEGRLMLAAPDRIFENPNGHGGSLTALLESGALDDMQGRGVDTLFYYQVDNPLAHLVDPALLGFHAGSGAEMSCKVVRKEQPDEKVGVLARRDGNVTVVEYTELDDAHRHAREADGGLRFWAGNLAIHVFSLAFVRRVAERAEELLPYHASAKKIPQVDDRGRPHQPEEPNGHKLERFVFDALPAARHVCVVETARSEEYSPVKNASGSDSPETSRRDLDAVYRRWLADAGIAAPPEGVAVEIDHARVDGPEDARALGIRSFEEAPDVIRTATGARP